MLDPTQFSQVYRGLAGECCCGCSGRHYTPDDNPAGFRRAIKRLGELVDAGAPGWDDKGMIVRIDARGVYQYVGYQKKA